MVDGEHGLWIKSYTQLRDIHGTRGELSHDRGGIVKFFMDAHTPRGLRFENLWLDREYNSKEYESREELSATVTSNPKIHLRI